MAGQVAVVGSANIDLVMRLPRLPRKGESVTADSFSRTFGGKGSNQAVAARRAGAEVTAVFNLGGDAEAGRLLETYREEGLDTARIRLNPGEACGTAIILVDAAGDNTIAIFPGANGSFRPEQVDEAAENLRGAALLMLQMEVADSVNRRAIEAAARGGTEVMLNFAPARPSDLRLDGSVGILVVNETEAATLTGLSVDDPAGAERAAAKLGENGHRLVIVTLGAQGCVTWEKSGEAGRHPAFPVTAADATAAGDSFCGSLGAALAAGRPLEAAIRFASAAGALCASRPGALPAVPHLREIEDFLRTGGNAIKRK